MNPRTSIEDLELTGSSKLRSAIKRQQQDADAPPLTPEQESEISKLDGLIAQAMKACAHGSTFRGKRNPAFANLAELVKVRKMLEGRKVDPAVEGQRVLREAKELFADMKKAS